MNEKICFIGAGNMTRSLIGGLIQDGVSAANIIATDLREQAGAELTGLFPGISFSSDNLQAATQADVVVLAVKPQGLQNAARELSPLQKQPLFLSIAAGIRSDDINRWLGSGRSVVRCMPNTPALVQSGASGLFANAQTSEEQKNLAERLMRSVGTACWVSKEDDIDLITALSGSGPAYFFYFIEAMQTAAIDMGLAEDTARLLALETAFGAAKLALESSDDAATLRTKVTSPGGTTEQAIATFNEQHLNTIIAAGMQAAAKRATELADLLGQDQ